MGDLPAPAGDVGRARMAAAFVGAFVAFLLGQSAMALQRRRALRLHRGALRAEINLCARAAGTYLRDGIAAPLYRLPTFVFPVSLPILLGSLTERSVEDLESFATLVQDINRGLDNAHQAAENKDDERLAKEVGRLRSKCHDLLNAHGENGKYEAYVTRARHALGIGGGN
jgi:hypothetical protein